AVLVGPAPARMYLEDVAIRGARNCVRVAEGAELHLAHASFHDCGDAGIWALGAQADIERTVFTDSGVGVRAVRSTLSIADVFMARVGVGILSRPSDAHVERISISGRARAIDALNSTITASDFAFRSLLLARRSRLRLDRGTASDLTLS